jgi:hypothetical protein
MPRLLNHDQRNQVMAAIDRALMLTNPDVFAGPNLDRPGGVKRIADHLDALVEIVRRTRSDKVEAFAWQVLEDVCEQCPTQEPNCHCALRYRNLCVLYRCLPVIVETIAGELVAMKDEAYFQTHPQWRLAADNWSQ